MIWASPVCTEYSARRPRRLEEGDRLVQRTLQIIQELQPRFWALENPATGLLLLRPFMAGLPWRDVSYCTYGYPYRKLTRVCASRLPLRAEGHHPPKGKNRAELPHPGPAVHSARPVPGDRLCCQRDDRDFALGFLSFVSRASILLWRLLQTPHSTAVSLQ